MSSANVFYPRQSFTARDGQSYVLRSMREQDMPSVHRVYNSLSDSDRCHRLLSITPCVSLELARKLCGVDQSNNFTLVVEGGQAYGNEIIAGARLANLKPGAVAEFAITARPEVRRLGLGRHLMQEIIRVAQRCGATGVEGLIASDNRKMLELVRSLGFVTKWDSDDYSLLHAVLTFENDENDTDAYQAVAA